MTPTSFSWHRFQLLLRRELYEHQKEYRNSFISFFLGCVFLATTALFVYRHLTETGLYAVDADGAAEASSIMIFLVMGIALLIHLSNLFAHLRTKQARINFFMVPASNCEKYLVRFFLCLVVGWGGSLLLIPVVDGLMWLIAQSLDFNYVHFTPLLLEHLGDMLRGLETFGVDSSSFIYIHPAYALTNALLAVLSFCTNYVIGAAIFRRFPFVLTSAAMVVISTLLTLLVSSGVFKLLGAGLFDFNPEETFDERTVSWFFITLLHLHFWFSLLWTVLGNYWVYRSFTRANAISNRTIGL